jgi:hypothetical protein
MPSLAPKPSISSPILRVCCSCRVRSPRVVPPLTPNQALKRASAKRRKRSRWTATANLPVRAFAAWRTRRARLSAGLRPRPVVIFAHGLAALRSGRVDGIALQLRDEDADVLHASQPRLTPRRMAKRSALVSSAPSNWCPHSCDSLESSEGESFCGGGSGSRTGGLTGDSGGSIGSCDGGAGGSSTGAGVGSAGFGEGGTGWGLDIAGEGG